MRTLTQKVAMVFGAGFLLFAVLGLLLPGGTGMEAHPAQAPKLLGLFPVNLLHNLVHMAFGVWGVASSRSWSAAKGYCRAGGAIYLVLMVLGWIVPDGFGLVPLGGNDPWLHLVLGGGLAYFGFLHREAGPRI